MPASGGWPKPWYYSSIGIQKFIGVDIYYHIVKHPYQLIIVTNCIFFCFRDDNKNFLISNAEKTYYDNTI